MHFSELSKGNDKNSSPFSSFPLNPKFLTNSISNSYHGVTENGGKDRIENKLLLVYEHGKNRLPEIIKFN